MTGAEYNFGNWQLFHYLIFINAYWKGDRALAVEVIEVPITGKMVDIKVSVGAKVEEGDIICIIEAMKMENPILSPVSGTVTEINVSPGQVAKSGEVIAKIDY